MRRRGKRDKKIVCWADSEVLRVSDSGGGQWLPAPTLPLLLRYRPGGGKRGEESEAVMWGQEEERCKTRVYDRKLATKVGTEKDSDENNGV